MVGEEKDDVALAKNETEEKKSSTATDVEDLEQGRMYSSMVVPRESTLCPPLMPGFNCVDYFMLPLVVPSTGAQQLMPRANHVNPAFFNPYQVMIQPSFSIQQDLYTLPSILWHDHQTTECVPVVEEPEANNNDNSEKFGNAREKSPFFVRGGGAGSSQSKFTEDNPVGNGNGVYQGRRLFRTKPGHASLVPLDGLLRAEDFRADSQNDQQGDGRNGGGERVLGRRKMRQQQQQQEEERQKRRMTPHHGRDDGVQEQNSEEDDEENDRTRLIDKTALADRAVITNVHHGKRRQPTPPNSSGSSSPKPQLPPSVGKHEVASNLVFDRLDAQDTCDNHRELDLGSLVELRADGLPYYGVVRWIGWLAEHDRTGVGVELEEELLGASNGWHRGTQLFACPEGRAVFVPFANVKQDERFAVGSSKTSKKDASTNDVPTQDEQQEQEEFGSIECPSVRGFHTPIKVTSLDNLHAKVVGRNKGIQGHQNSCYLDATLFAMFSFTSVFDSLLYRPPTQDDIPEYLAVQKVLREEVVNPLRKNIFVRADKVMKLRKLLDGLTSVRGLTTEEKDPEEFLNSLLTQTLRASPFLELSSGQTAHLYQLFVEKREGVQMPTVQELFEQSFRTSEIKLKKVPAVLVLQMPRFGRQYKVYDRIVPSQILDVTDVIEDSPRQCIVCGKLAALECLECFGAHGCGPSSGLDSTSFCKECAATVHNHQKRKSHKIMPISVPEEFLSNRSSDYSIPRLYMELFAVVCIETSHYVAFVRSGLGPDAAWCFFDSMADRKGEADGYNIPEVSEANDVLHWMSEEGARTMAKTSDNKSLPVHAKRLICDGYMCFYQSPQAIMYQ